MEKASTNALARLTLRNCATITMAKTMNSRTINQLVYTRRRVNPYCWMYKTILLRAVTINRRVSAESNTENTTSGRTGFSPFFTVNRRTPPNTARLIIATPQSSKKPWRAYSA